MFERTAICKIVKPLVALVVLAGCAGTGTNEQATKEAIAQEKAQAAVIAQQDDARCQSFGATPGSEAYARCRASLTNHRAEVNRSFGGPKE
jgi:hypothetical protein